MRVPGTSRMIEIRHALNDPGWHLVEGHNPPYSNRIALYRGTTETKKSTPITTSARATEQTPWNPDRYHQAPRTLVSVHVSQTACKLQPRSLGANSKKLSSVLNGDDAPIKRRGNQASDIEGYTSIHLGHTDRRPIPTPEWKPQNAMPTLECAMNPSTLLTQAAFAVRCVVGAYAIFDTPSDAVLGRNGLADHDHSGFSQLEECYFVCC